MIPNPSMLIERQANLEAIGLIVRIVGGGMVRTTPAEQSALGTLCEVANGNREAAYLRWLSEAQAIARAEEDARQMSLAL